MSSTVPDLPPQLAEIAEITGVAAALKLADAFGGQELYVPKSPRTGQRVVGAIGLDAARKLARIYGGGRVDVPLAAALSRQRRNALIVRAVEVDGRSKASVARDLKMTTRGVRKIVNGTKARDNRQGELI